MELCLRCGQVAFLAVDDLVYELREFTLTSCCDANLSGWLEDMATWKRRQRSAGSSSTPACAFVRS